MEWFADNGWVAWVGIALVLAALEVLTVTFFFLMFTFGALAGALAAALGAPVAGQIVIAVLVALALTGLVRPALVNRMARQGVASVIGAKANIGREAVVLETVTTTGGRVKLAGEVWSARSADSRIIRPGQTVQVVSLDGATAIVAEPVVPAAGAPAERM